MLNYFRLPTGHSHTVNTVVEEAYSLIEPGTTATEDSTRRSGAIAALRALNTGLPADDDTTITLPFVWLSRIRRIPFRIPDVGPAGLRSALASEKIHDLFTLTRMSAEFVHDLLPGGTATPTEVERLMAICRLMKVRGMSVDIAVALHDHTIPITSPRAIYETDQGTIKSVIEAADPTMPSELVARRPWFQLQRNARRHAPRGSSGRPVRHIGGFPASRLEVEIEYWTGETRNPGRRSAERASAEVVAFLFRVQREIALGNAQLARGSGRGAYVHYRRIWAMLGERALDLGLIVSSSPEVTGPSVQTILEVAAKLLDRIDPADARLARQRFGLQPERPGEGLQSLRLTDLEDGLGSPKESVLDALQANPIWHLGRDRVRQALALLSDFNVDAITTVGAEFSQGLATGNMGARVADLRSGDREVLVENLGAATVEKYAGTFASAWSALEADIQLNDIKGIVGDSLGTSPPSADTVVNSAASSLFPSSFLAQLGAFDRFYAWRPSSRADHPAKYVAVNAEFPAAYRETILVFFRDERLQDVWHFRKADFVDPARFAFLIPAMIIRPLARVLARSLNPTGHMSYTAALERAFTAEMNEVETNEPATPLYQMVSTGTRQLIPGETPPTYSLEDATAEMAMAVKEGDEAYMASSLTVAAAAYERAIEIAKLCPELSSAAGYVRPLHTHLVEQVRVNSAAGVRTRVRVADWAVETTATAIVVSVFPGLFPTGAVTIDITERYTARVPSAQAVTFYDIVAEDLPAGQEFSDVGGGDAIPAGVEDESDEVELLELDYPPPIIHPPKGGGGGGGGGPGGTSTPPPVVDVEEAERLLLHASVHLEQIRVGLNWLGLDPDAVPPWRFDFLLAQSRYYAEKADSLQQRAMSLLQAAEGAVLQEFEARTAVALAAAGIEVAKAQESLANAQLDAAIAAEDAAGAAEMHSKDDKWWALAGGLAEAVSAGISGAVTGAAVGTAGGPVGTAVGAVAGALGGVISAAQGFDRASEAQNEAEAQAAVAAAQTGVAEEQVALASEQLALAEMQAAIATEYLTLVEDADLTSSGYYELLDIVGAFSQSYLRMANRLAFLAERAYQFESRRYSSFIAMDYGAQDSLDGRFQSGARLLTDLDALEHERITATVDRYQLIKTTFSLLTHMPGSLHFLRETGQTLFRLDPKTLDLRFPGMYLHSLKRIEIEFDGLLPTGGVTAVLRLTNNSFVRVPNDPTYVPDPSLVLLDWPYPASTHSVEIEPGKTKAPFVLKPLLGVGFRQILSEYRRSHDSVVLAPPEGALDVFENLPMDLLFSLELPATANGFPFQHLADARVTLYFTAQHSDVLAVDQQKALEEGGRVSRATALLATAHAADSLATFRATPLDPKRRDIRLLTFAATADRFPAHTRDRVIENFQVALLGLAGTTLKVKFAGEVFPFAPTVNTTLQSSDVPAGVPAHVPDGMVFTALGEVDQMLDPETVLYETRAGTYPDLETLVGAVADGEDAANYENVVGTYVLKILPDGNDAHCVRDDAGVIVDTPATEVALPSGGSITHDTGSWLDVDVRVLVALAEGTFDLVVRHSATGADNVIARLVVSFGTTYQVQASIHHGATPTQLATVTLPDINALDAVYDVRLRVVGLTAALFIDGVPVTLIQDSQPVREVSLPSSTPAAGTVHLAASGNTTDLKVAAVQVTRLRYDGTPLGSVLDETFDTLDAWTAAGSATLANVNHRMLDLSFIEDVILQLDFTTAFDFPFPLSEPE